MANLTEEQKSFMTDLYHTYELTADDVFKHAHFTIIRLSGVNKIMAKAGIEIDYNVEGCNAQYAAVRCEATFPDGQRIVTFGSASPDNCRSPYYLEMAEKRAKSRAVLMLCGCYGNGVYSEAEEAHIN